ncbi:enoyl-CoA hydratase-related protein [Beijerinckia sp. L45]|uniref:enoyl-CoA hydratase-related protein n=1 Tax=Beijerinckia sp. L45 TaxID=1641855 RepID=UPI001AEEFC95|nr:enoyl-CoA hydratase-related protein [Beijerinckia sp. L45]
MDLRSPKLSRRSALLAAASVSLATVPDLEAADHAETGRGSAGESFAMRDVPSGTGSTVTVERRGQIVMIGLDRPSEGNRIDPSTHLALSRAYYEYEHDPSLRAAVLFGRGVNFCEGIDVAAFAAVINSGDDRIVKPHTIDPWGKSKPRISKPVVVVAHGNAFNIGHELCIACDVRIASADARFAQTENAQARMPGSGGTIRFVREAGWAQAMRYLLTGDPWSAEDARRMGLFQEVGATPEAALQIGIDIAMKIAACAPKSVKATLASAHLAIDKGEDEAFAALPAQRAALYRTKDFQEGIRSHAEKRKAVYNDE